MKAPSKRSVLIALPLTLVAMGVVRHHQEDGAWQSAEEHARRWQAEVSAQSRERSVLHGSAVEGEAWPHYERALDHVHELLKENDELCKHLYSDDPMADPDTREFLASLDGALDDLRQGAQRSIGGMPIQWEKGCSAKIPRLRSTRVLLIALKHKAGAELEAGNPHAAVDRWLDGLQLGRDLSQSHLLIARCIGHSVTSTVLEQVDESELPANPARRLARALKKLDPIRSGPDRCLSSEAALFVRTSVDHGSDCGLIGMEGSWRYAWSYPRLLEEFCAEIDAADQELQGLEDLPLEEVLQTTRRLNAEFEDHGNPLLGAWVTHLDSVFLSEARAQAHVRMARMALDDNLQLEDPWGSGFRVSEGALVSERDGQELSFRLR